MLKLRVTSDSACVGGGELSGTTTIEAVISVTREGDSSKLN
jgi:hypothetical protein